MYKYNTTIRKNNGRLYNVVLQRILLLNEHFYVKYLKRGRP